MQWGKQPLFPIRVRKVLINFFIMCRYLQCVCNMRRNWICDDEWSSSCYILMLSTVT
jgi:hypothetical protein